MHLLIKLTLAGVLLLKTVACPAQRSERYADRINSLLNTTAVRPFSGVVMIAQHGKVKFASARGYADAATKAALHVDAPFVILSNSKQITAVLTLLEVEKGRVNLQAPISTYLPEIKQPWADTVTVHQLLNHTSGIADVHRRLLFGASSNFKYSDLNYVLLGKIIERTTGDTYQKAANALFNRLGMKNSYFPDSTQERKPINGYRHSNNHPIKEVRRVVIPKERIPAAGLVSTARDLIRWNTLLHGGRILQKTTYASMIGYSIKAQHPVFGDAMIGYGYGIRINDLAYPKELGHTGFVPAQGFTSVNLYYPNEGVSVVVLENQAFDDSSISYHHEKEIRKIVLNSTLLKSSSKQTTKRPSRAAGM